MLKILASESSGLYVLGEVPWPLNKSYSVGQHINRVPEGSRFLRPFAGFAFHVTT